MSASSKKKLRNEQQTAKMTEKQVAEQKEAKKLTLYTTIFVVVLAVMVVFAIAIGVTRSITNSGVHERNTVALTVGDHEISNAELNYFYMSAINNFNSNYGSYAAMLGLDTSKPLNEQVINNDTGLTWADDFLNTAKDNARSTYALADAAEAAGFTLSEDDLADIDSTINNMKLYANLYGYSSTKDFLKAQYGNGATEESYRQYVTLNALASAYRNSYSSSLTYTDADLRAADKGRAGNHVQPAGNGRFRFGGRGHVERAAVYLHSTIDRAAVQRQTVRGINIAGDAVPVHVDGRRGVDGEVFRDAVEQRDLAFLHIVQDLLHRFILRPAALRDVVRPAASFAVLRDVGEDCRGQRRQTERQRHEHTQYSFFHKILL